MKLLKTLRIREREEEFIKLAMDFYLKNNPSVCLLSVVVNKEILEKLEKADFK